jgi:hypothetical protein
MAAGSVRNHGDALSLAEQCRGLAVISMHTAMARIAPPTYASTQRHNCRRTWQPRSVAKRYFGTVYNSGRSSRAGSNAASPLGPGNGGSPAPCLGRHHSDSHRHRAPVTVGAIDAAADETMRPTTPIPFAYVGAAGPFGASP